MAKLKGMPVARKPPSLKGVAYISTWRGIAILRKWPKKQTRPLPAKVLNQQEWFRQANALTKYIAPDMQISAREATKNTPLYPRDILIALMAGTLFSLKLDDGRTLHSVATRNGVSESLDVFGVTQGQVLYRKADHWDVLPPGTEDQVLTTKGPDKDPVWQTPPSGAGIWSEIASKTPASGIIDFQSLSLSSYQEIELRFLNVAFDTTKDNLRVQLYIAGTLITSGYRYRTSLIASNGNSNGTWSTTGSAWFLNSDTTGWEVSTTSKAGFSGVLYISNPTDICRAPANVAAVVQHDGGNASQVRTAGNIDQTGVIDGFKISGPSQNLGGGEVVIVGRA